MFIRCQTKFLDAFKKYSDDFRTIHKKIIKKSEILKKNKIQLFVEKKNNLKNS